MVSESLTDMPCSWVTRIRNLVHNPSWLLPRGRKTRQQLLPRKCLLQPRVHREHLHPVNQQLRPRVTRPMLHLDRTTGLVHQDKVLEAIDQGMIETRMTHEVHGQITRNPVKGMHEVQDQIDLHVSREITIKVCVC